MINIAILGLGIVGSGTADLLTQNCRIIEERAKQKINIKYILDIRDLPQSPYRDKLVRDIDIILNDPEISIVAELIGGSHPAYDFSMRALSAGKHVVTSNKEVVAKYGDKLLACAEEHNVKYLFEASVGGGIPIIRPLTADLAANDIYEINGILNGTTNYILTSMFSAGKDYESALAEAKAKGYAEANPAADVEGVDSCRKICILAALAFGTLIPLSSIHTEGIGSITTLDIENAEAAGCKIKLIGRVVRENSGKLRIMVCPCLVSLDNPLSHIDDVYNGIMVKGNFIGDVMFYGRGAGALPTASAVVSDIINIADGTAKISYSKEWRQASPEAVAPLGTLVTSSYICVKEVPAGEEFIKSCFGDVRMLPSSQKGTLAFISPEMTEEETENKLEILSNIGATLVSRIRVLK